jgi:hypothetical protein
VGASARARGRRGGGRAAAARRGRLALARAALALVVTAGLCEVLGFATFTLGARHGIAVAAVLSAVQA